MQSPRTKEKTPDQTRKSFVVRPNFSSKTYMGLIIRTAREKEMSRNKLRLILDDAVQRRFISGRLRREKTGRQRLRHVFPRRKFAEGTGGEVQRLAILSWQSRAASALRNPAVRNKERRQREEFVWACVHRINRSAGRRSANELYVHAIYYTYLGAACLSRALAAAFLVTFTHDVVGERLGRRKLPRRTVNYH
ncbi:hypothetical protein PUN28_005779 [Cardiocondyla obscurior]|uniref:Uncharacterized protein n=1 Tax=Cardiocondyla obscurior TaxID=286306 RepID=A0AAW2G7X6_9HYME